MKTLGINIGSSSLKVVLLEDSTVIWSDVRFHDGDFSSSIKEIFLEHKIPEKIPAIITGTEGRFLFNINNVIEPLCIEKAIEYTGEKFDAVVTMGGEDLIVYTINSDNKIVNNFSGSKCASGTGEFFKQQLGRMDMTLEDVAFVPETSQVLPLSSRCSVFMKSDCTHRLNKNEATKEDIVVSLSNVMAEKVIDFLKRARITKGKVLLTGGTTKNNHIIRFIKEKAPEIEFIIPESASYFEALGAALIAEESGAPLPSENNLMKENKISYDTYDDLKKAKDLVTYFEASKGKIIEGREYILGIDGGSTTTKVTLIDYETNEIVASYYGRTHGDPVKSLKTCLIEVQKQIKEAIGDNKIHITLAATTGSSREILGVFMETPGVYNEIIAHAEGTTHFSDDVDTIFEIGGQDAKYVLLKNRVPIDYAMNEACSAGTGSFLEESAHGDLNIQHAWEIADIALASDHSLKFGENCSAFINSDIRKAIQQGATKESITGGIVTSIVSNYLNRVVGNRTIGNKIFLQGGVAKNKAIPLAFSMLLDKEILVPPSPELMGCFGVGLLAKEKFANGLLEKKEFDLEKLINQEIIYERVFTCRSCENLCPIQVLNVNNHKYMFGGRCSKYTNTTKKVDKSVPIFDYVEKRTNLLFSECAPNPLDFVKKRSFTVGIPKAFSVHTLYPLYSWFFHMLGIPVILSDTISKDGIARAESSYCYPAEIAHGAVQDIVNKDTDYIFVPHFRDMPSYEDKVHANFCPITQSLPYYIRKAFPDVPSEKILSPVITFKFGKHKALEYFVTMGNQLGISPEEVEEAFNIAYEKQEDYFNQSREMGKQALMDARKADRPVIAILGRPYNAFTKDANMGIPRKFTSRGYSVIPFDILPFEDSEIFDNMYWYYGQQDMKVSSMLKDEPNIFVTWISNFSCAPDSFMLHYVKWMMGTKPFLILEFDSHTADAGIDTRVEAFLDIIDGYKSKIGQIKEERYTNGLKVVNNGDDEIHVYDSINDRKINVRNNPRVKILLSNMGDLSAQMMASSIRAMGFNAEAMPISDRETLQIARRHTSGKECVPSHLVLGSALKYFASEKYRKEELYLLFVPITSGPCRTGQYYIFMENLFRDLGLENVVIFTLSADNSYTELGPGFSKTLWRSTVISDYMKDIQNALRACAVDPKSALETYHTLWQELLGEAETGFKHATPVLKRIAKEISLIPLRQKLKDSPKVLIVGEIYVRRDDFAVDDLVELFSQKGIIAKVAGIGEWIHYLDFVRHYDWTKRLKLIPWWKRPFSKPARDLFVLAVEKLWKHSVEKKVGNALAAANLIPETPHDMDIIMKNSEDNFVSHELNSEITVSSGVAATAMEHGYSGVVNISPFACLIGRVIEGLYAPWARDRKYPIISVEIDGNVLPPNMISKLNIFMVNVLRFKDNPGKVDMIDYNETGKDKDFIGESGKKETVTSQN